MKQPLVWGLVLCVLLLVGGTWVAAQSAGSASLRGTVKDPTGAVVPGADVTIINENTKDERHTITDEAGGFYFGALRPGLTRCGWNYRVSRLMRKPVWYCARRRRAASR